MTRPGASCLVLALLCVIWPCPSLAADEQSRFLNPGDRVVFLGDSITFQGIYTKKIEQLVDEAHGNGNITFVNAGLGSDAATNGLRRFEKDVLAHDPTVVVFCFGMNDAVVRTPNAPVNDAALAAFLDSHRQMVRICQENGIRPFILSSSPARPDLIGELEGHNARLEVFADGLLELARELKVCAADVFHMLLERETARRAQDPPQPTLIPDGVHPGEPACELMARLVAEAWGLARFPKHGFGPHIHLDPKSFTDRPRPMAKGRSLVSMTVHDGSNTDLDGNCGPNTAPNTAFPIGTPGSSGGEPIYYVSKFKLDHLLGRGARPEDITAVTLIVPDQDIKRNGNPGRVPMHVWHFATTDDSTVVAADGGYRTKLTPALHDFGPVLGGRDPLEPDTGRRVRIDVTDAVRDDLRSGRALSSFRIGPTPQDAAKRAGSHQVQIGDSNAIADGRPDFAPPGGEGLIRLRIVLGAAGSAGHQGDEAPGDQATKKLRKRGRSEQTAPDIFLVREGRRAAYVFAPGENQWAGMRLVDRIRRWTDVELQLVTSTAVPTPDSPVIAIGSPQTNPLIEQVAGDDPRWADLGEQGYLVSAVSDDDRNVLVLGGAQIDGVNNAVSELLSWKTFVTADSVTVPGSLDESAVPGLTYRLLWNWNSRTNWRPTIKEMHARHYQRYNLIEEGEATYVTHFKRAIDFFSDHKLNGLMVWGFIHEDLGGVEAARELTRYGRRNNVRILPGVCTEAAYGGFSYLSDSPFNLTNWTEKHPDLRYKNTEGEYIAGICPSKPRNIQWLRDGTRWFFDELPDVGGMNLENGDWFYCWTEDCVEAKSHAENDPNFYWDQMATYKPVLEEARKISPDAWMIYAIYTGFTEQAIRDAMDGAIKTKRAVGVATELVLPPRVLNQLPDFGTVQWTLTGMAGPHAWPQDAVLPAAKAPHHVGYIHQSGAVSGLSNPEKWWGKDPGSGYEDVAEIIKFVCMRAAESGMHGIAIYGERGAVSPANELNYLALEYFGWYPDHAWEQFVEHRLSAAYGGRERARKFLLSLINTTRDPSEIREDKEKAEATAAEPSLDLRQRRRWRNLAAELDRRATLAEKMTDQEQS